MSEPTTTNSLREPKNPDGFILLLGVGLCLVGIFGVWLQSPFWEVTVNQPAMADMLIVSDVVMSFALPAMVTTLGGCLMSWVILASDLAERRWPNRKTRLFLVFTAAYLVLLFVSAQTGGSRLWEKARTTLDRHWVQPGR